MQLAESIQQRQPAGLDPTRGAVMQRMDENKPQSVHGLMVLLGHIRRSIYCVTVLRTDPKGTTDRFWRKFHSTVIVREQRHLSMWPLRLVGNE